MKIQYKKTYNENIFPMVEFYNNDEYKVTTMTCYNDGDVKIGCVSEI